MRKVLAFLAVGSLIFLMFTNQVSALDDPKFWLKAASNQSTTTYTGKFSNRGQCYGEMANTSSGSQAVCTTHTSWGKISEAGMAKNTVSGTYRPLILRPNQHLLASPDSRRLYFSEGLGNDTMKIGYIDNVVDDISYDTQNNIYALEPNVQPEYLDTIYKNIAFSNDSRYVVGLAANGALVRTSLVDFSTKSFVGNNPAITVSSTVRWAISNTGDVVAGMNSANVAIVYDVAHCTERFIIPDLCETKQVSRPENMATPAESLYMEDGGDGISIYSQPFGANITRISISINYDSLNRYVSYVALGDSFSSGEGAWWYENNTDGNNGYEKEKCHQSAYSYPFQYAQHYFRWSDEYYEPRLDGDMVIRANDFTDAACSGAETWNVLTIGANQNPYVVNPEAADDYPGQFEQFSNVDSNLRLEPRDQAVISKIPGRALQVDFLKTYKPTIATIGIGGNDIGFSKSLEACLASITTCPHASSRKWDEGKKIYDEFKRLDTLFTELQKASPTTKLFAVGYPKIISDEDYVCGVNVLLDAWERDYVKKGTVYLNQIIKAAAEKNGIGYIDFENTIANQGLCGSSRGVNGLSLGNDKKEITLLGKKYYIFANESFHPTSLGQSLMSDTLINNYGELDRAPYPSCTKNTDGICSKSWIKAPTIPSYFGTWNSDAVVAYKQFTSTATSGNIAIQLGNFLKNSRVKVTIFSEPYELGTFATDNNGELNKELTLPSFIEPGYHTIYLEGKDEGGNPIEYQQVILYLPDDTQTGPCSFMPYSNLDQDSDGIDDACDDQIDVENQATFANPADYLTYPNPERPRPILQNNQPTMIVDFALRNRVTQSNNPASSMQASNIIFTPPASADAFASATSPLLPNLANTHSALATSAQNNRRSATQSFLHIAAFFVISAVAVTVVAYVIVQKRVSKP